MRARQGGGAYGDVCALLPAAGTNFNNPRHMNMNAPVLQLESVGRRIAGRDIVRGLDFAVARGETLGLLGVNGAGKTTTLRMVAGVLAPSAGRVLLGGEDLYEQPALARRRIGYLPETPPLHAELTTREYLVFCARLHGIARGAVVAAVDRAIERCDLGDVARRLLGALSKGYRTRVGVAQAIVHEPDLIVLDEPASGLDPVQTLKLRELVRNLGREHALVLSTHVLPDVAACCDRVAIVHRGELRHVGAAVEPVADVLQVGVARVVDAAQWSRLPMVADAQAVDATRWRVRVHAGTAIDDFAAALVGAGIRVMELRADATPLESTFLAITASDVAEAA